MQVMIDVKVRGGRISLHTRLRRGGNDNLREENLALDVGRCVARWLREAVMDKAAGCNVAVTSDEELKEDEA